jgi:Cu2+-exporting ATPase
LATILADLPNLDALGLGKALTVVADSAPPAVLLLDIDGMKCGGCLRAVEQKLLAQPGVRQASVNLLSRTAWVELDASPTDPGAQSLAKALAEALAGLSFAARVRDAEEAPASRRERLRQRHWWQQWRQLLVALALLLVSGLGHLAMAGQLPPAAFTSLLSHQAFHALVASLALGLPGRQILWRGAIGALKGLPSMDTLVGLGVTSAYLASWLGLLWPAAGWPCFFNEPVMLLGFVLLGRFLEERARYRSGRAIEQLAQLQPDTALLLLGDEPPRPVRVGGLRPGDRLRLLPGDRVPVDALVREGSSALDISALTGEPLPLEAKPGTELAAGSLNLEAPLVLEVRRSGRDSAVARIIQLVERAQSRKAPIQGLADRLAGGFTLVVLALALVTFLFWWLWGARQWPALLVAAGHHAGHLDSVHSAIHGAIAQGVMAQGAIGPEALGAALSPMALALQLAIAVLVVACPCALGLATPTAIAVGIGQAARAGLLFRGGDAIEMAAGLRKLLFDKTGTLTLGRPVLSAIRPQPGVTAERLLQVAASLEAGSRHPLAFAVLQEAERQGLAPLPVSDGRSVAGAGLEGWLQGRFTRVGRPDWVDLAGQPGPPADDGATWLAVRQGPELLGLLAAADALRPDAAATLAALRAEGMSLGLLSGDREAAVRRLGAEVGLEAQELAWSLTPEQKLERLGQDRQHRPLAMVGDGINDAPALAAADLGVAVGTGTQIAQETADLVVLGERLDGLLRALVIARRTMAKVRQNLFWAFGYNLLVLPIAAGVLLPGYGLLLTPPLAALLMSISSITVVVNALLLQNE